MTPLICSHPHPYVFALEPNQRGQKCFQHQPCVCMMVVTAHDCYDKAHDDTIGTFYSHTGHTYSHT